MRIDAMIRKFNVSCDFIRHSVCALIFLTACAQLPAVQLQQTVIKDGCSKYQDPKSLDLQKKFKEPAMEKGCIACHLDCNQLPAGYQQESPDYYLKAQEPALCLECHTAAKKDLAPAHGNQPLGNSKCSGCHDPHSSNIPKLIREFSHGPFKARLCSACHPAPVNDKVQLTAADVDLQCYECHTQFKEEMQGTKSRHKLLSQSNRSCMECHDPHAANQEYVLKKPVQDLCLDCHVEPLNKTTPNNQDRSMPSPQAVNTSKRADDRNTQYLELSNKYVHEPANVSCAFCHDAHASDYPAELYAPVQDVCLACHGSNAERIIRSDQPFPLLGGRVILPPKTFKTLTMLNLVNDQFGHPTSNHPVYAPATADRPELSCVTCHDPHSISTGPKLLVANQQALCARCHKM